VELLQRVLAVAGFELRQCVGRHPAAVAGAAALRIIVALLAHCYPVEHLPFDVELAVRLFEEVVVQTPSRAFLRALAEERLVPLFDRGLGVVLGVLELDADDGEAVDRLGPGGRRGRAGEPAAAAEPPAARAALTA